MSKEPERFETACPICGKPILHVIPADSMALRDVLMRLAKRAVHDHCDSAEAKKQNDRSAHERLVLQTQKWGTVCPPLYQNTDEKRLRAETNGKLDKVLAWEFGAKGLMLFGPTRTGKTRSVYALLRRLFDQDKAIAAMTHSEFSITVATMQGNDNQWKLQRWCDVMRRLDVLFIDDLGKGRMARMDGNGSAAEEVLFHIFEERLKGCMPTLWTSEHNGRSLMQRLSSERAESFVARLREFSLTIEFPSRAAQ